MAYKVTGYTKCTGNCQAPADHDMQRGVLQFANPVPYDAATESSYVPSKNGNSPTPGGRSNP